MPGTAAISLFTDIADIIMPVSWNAYQQWTAKVMDRESESCRTYLLPNRRDFYKIMYSSKGMGLFTIGLKTYLIEKPTILFLHPNEIITWRSLSPECEGYICFFKKKLVDEHTSLKLVMDKYKLFTDTDKNVIQLPEEEVPSMDKLFAQLYEIDLEKGGSLAEDSLQAFLQLIMTNSVRVAKYPEPDAITDEFKHVHDFFQLLEKETANINYSAPVQIRTAKEFADKLFVHPNHLNALLKKHTGQNLSTHIKNRLLEESKILLLQTDWTLQDIGYAIGYADQPNFSQFFKKNTGVTPAEFRKNNTSL
jgi:AraC family transcriptional activator of pobA